MGPERRSNDGADNNSWTWFLDLTRCYGAVGRRPVEAARARADARRPLGAGRPRV